MQTRKEKDVINYICSNWLLINNYWTFTVKFNIPSCESDLKTVLNCNTKRNDLSYLKFKHWPCNISKMGGSVSSGYPNTYCRRESKIQSAADFFNQIWGVWVADETQSWVFDISSIETKTKKVNREVKTSKSILKTGFPNLLYGCDFRCFNLMSY